MTRGRICIIGGGPTGIGVAHALSTDRFDYELFEAEDELGGVWNTGSAAGRTYPSLHLISPKFNTQVADFPMPADYPHYPSHTQMLAYIRAYARSFGLYERAHLGAPIAALEPVGRRWRVRTASGEAHEFDLAIVCTGLQRVPRLPDPPYPGSFDGEVLHSSQYKHREQLAGRRVLVIGGGNSGCDIAVAAVHHASAVAYSTRRGYHYQPKFIMGKPTPQWLMELGNKFDSKEETLAYVEEVYKLAGYDGTDYGLPAPDHPLDAAHPVMNSQLLFHVGHGDISPKPDVERFAGRTVHFVDGSTAQIDLIVYATGYDRDLSFIDAKLLEWRDGLPDLFLHSTPRNHDNLLFMGFINAAGGLGDGLKTQGRFVSSYARALFGATAGLQAFLRAKQVDEPDLGQGYFVDSRRHRFEADLWKLLTAMRRYGDMLERV